MNSIMSLQNDPQMLKLLAAQRQCYSDAKIIMNFQFIFLCCAPIVSIFTLLIGKHLEWNTTYISAFFCLLGILFFIFDTLFLVKKSELYRTFGASIQELFDTTVLNIDWNYTLCGQKPDRKKINNHHGSYVERGNTIEPLSDWYGIVDPSVDELVAKTQCQKVNIYYDCTLRFRFNLFTAICFFVILTSIFYMSIYINLDALSCILYFGQFLPFVKFIAQNYLSNAKAIGAIESVKSLTDGTIMAIISGFVSKSAVDKNFSRRIQDSIFMNRKNSQMIPDWFYQFNRKSLEKLLPG